MKRKTNCPNCAAPLEIGQVKCPYCGTTYYDLSAIDFDSYEPIFLTIKKNGYLITQKVVPKYGSITVEADSVCARGGCSGAKLMQFSTGQTVTTSIEFDAIPIDNKIFAKIMYEGD